MIAAGAMLLIDGYQTFISPYKGFSCAYRVRFDDLSCSEYAKRLIGKLGFLDAIPKIRERFNACKDAAIALKEKVSARLAKMQEDFRTRRERRAWSPSSHVDKAFEKFSEASCDCAGELVPRLVSESLSKSGCGDWSAVDFSTCDTLPCDGIGDCDCGGCDISF